MATCQAIATVMSHRLLFRCSFFILYLLFPRAIALRSFLYYTNTTTITISTDMHTYIYIHKCVSSVMHIIVVCIIEVINRIKKKTAVRQKNRQMHAILYEVLEHYHAFSILTFNEILQNKYFLFHFVTFSNLTRSLHKHIRFIFVLTKACDILRLNIYIYPNRHT